MKKTFSKEFLKDPPSFHDPNCCNENHRSKDNTENNKCQEGLKFIFKYK